MLKYILMYLLEMIQLWWFLYVDLTILVLKLIFTIDMFASVIR